MFYFILFINVFRSKVEALWTEISVSPPIGVLRADILSPLSTWGVIGASGLVSIKMIGGHVILKRHTQLLQDKRIVGEFCATFSQLCS